jgi:CheY-like chemotaxis protein
LGLSIVYGIVRQHAGHVECLSEPGAGTTFHVYLPLLRREKPVEAEQEDSLPVPRGHETILLAEDDGATRKVIRDVLETFGYTVMEALDGSEAVERFRDAQDRIDLVILDAIMPKKGGREAYEEIKAMRPGVVVVFISGYVGDPSWLEWVAAQRATAVQKPIGPRDLVRRIRALLDRGEA